MVDGAGPERLDRAGELRGADLRQPRTRLLDVERRVVDLALGAIGAGDQVDPDALGNQASDGAAGAHRLVVGMGVDEEDAAGRFSLHDSVPSRCSESRW